MAAAWLCGRCGRRVPGYVATCHCGAGRTETGASAPTTMPSGSGARFNPREVPWPAWVAVTVVALALVGGLINLVRRHEPEPIVPLLGYVDHKPATRTLPSPAPSPKVSAAAARP